MTNPPAHLSDADLNAWLDGALDPMARAAAATHLAVCHACAERLTNLQVVFASLDAWPDTPLQRDLSPGVLAAISKTRPITGRLRGALIAQAAAALVVLSLSMPVFTGGMESLDVSAWALSLPSAIEAFGADATRATSGFVIPLLGQFQAFAAGVSADAGLTLQTYAGALGTCASIAALLWLAGNTVLLRPRLFRSRRQS